jgi:hypothetical protein
MILVMTRAGRFGVLKTLKKGMGKRLDSQQLVPELKPSLESAIPSRWRKNLVS